MAIKHKTRVKETASNKPNASTAFSLPGSAATGYRTFAAAYVNGDELPYTASNGTDWESGIATFTTSTPNTLVRTQILESSNGDVAVDFSAGANVELMVGPSAALANNAETVLTDSNKLQGYGFFVESDGVTNQTTTDAAYQTLHGGAGGVLNTVRYNVGNVWTADSLGKFVPQAGRWLVGGCAIINGITSAQRYIVALFKNGSASAERILVRGGLPASTNILGGGGSTIIQANGTDYYQLKVFVDGSGTHIVGVTSGPGFCNFWANYLGPVL